jgi:hypothetical protein
VDSTLVLTFASGERIETTLNHPCSVEDKGFVPAGQLAIGNAIITRAGPDVEVVGIEWKGQPNRVYNFTVQDEHTYIGHPTYDSKISTAYPINVVPNP